MARWDVQQHRDKTAITYINLYTHQTFDCGDQRTDVPVNMILDWIAENADSGDAVFLNGKPIMSKMQPARA